MPSYYQDPDFQDKLLAHVLRDKSFMKEIGTLLTAEDFKQPRQESGNGNGQAWCRWLIATLALKYWEHYRTPIRKLIRSEVLEYVQKQHLQQRQQKVILSYVDYLRKQSLEAGESLREKVVEFKCEKARLNFFDEMIDLEQRGELTNEKLRESCHAIIDTFEPDKFVARSYFSREELEARMHRRSIRDHENTPLFFIDPLDGRIDTIRRGQIGIWLAPPGRGKSLACNHTALAYALQGFHAALIECEDMKEIVEDRLDAGMSQLPMSKLFTKQDMFQKRWRNVRRWYQGNLTLIDATDERVTLSWVESRLDELKDRGEPVDALIIDYDDEVVSPIKNRDRHDLEIAETYRRLRVLAAKHDLYLWMACQTKSGRDKKMILTDDDIANAPGEKLRKCALMIGVGNGSELGEDVHYLQVIKNKNGPKKFGLPIAHDEERGIFYHRHKTQKLYERLAEERAEKSDT